MTGSILDTEGAELSKIRALFLTSLLYSRIIQWKQKISVVQDSKGLKKVILRRMALLGKTRVEVVTGQTQTRRYKKKGRGSYLSKGRNQSHRLAAVAKIYGRKAR